MKKLWSGSPRSEGFAKISTPTFRTRPAGGIFFIRKSMKEIYLIFVISILKERMKSEEVDGFLR